MACGDYVTMIALNNYLSMRPVRSDIIGNSVISVTRFRTEGERIRDRETKSLLLPSAIMLYIM